MVQACTETLGWVLVCKKCGPVTGQNFLDAEMGGCGILLETLRPWIEKSVCFFSEHHAFLWMCPDMWCSLRRPQGLASMKKSDYLAAPDRSCLFVHCSGTQTRSSPCPSLGTKLKSTRHRQASNTFRAAHILRCERIVLDKGAKVLISECAQGICPPHHGRRRS